MGPIWPAIKSATSQHALLQEYLRGGCTGVRDFEDAENRRERVKKKSLKWKEGTLKFQGIFPDVAQIFCWGNPDVLTLFIPSLLLAAPLTLYNSSSPFPLEAAHHISDPR